MVEAAAELGGRGYVADITNARDIARAVEMVGEIHVLVNNAGLERLTPVDEISEEAEAVFRRVVEINVVGTYLATRSAVRSMPRGGAIVNTASVWSRSSEAGFSAYVASKHATIGLTKTWAKELGPRGIRVNAVCPGWVRTAASMLSLRRMSERSGRPEQAILDEVLAGQIIGGLMEPDDVAGPYLFLASDLASTSPGSRSASTAASCRGEAARGAPGARHGRGQRNRARDGGRARGGRRPGRGARSGLACRVEASRRHREPRGRGAGDQGVAEAAAHLGGLDILINNAGIMRESALRDTTAADIDLHFAVNVRGAILAAREALKVMQAGARIVNVASELAYLGRQNASVYVATKAALLGADPLVGTRAGA